jgi:hypothetical protein
MTPPFLGLTGERDDVVSVVRRPSSARWAAFFVQSPDSTSL